MVVNVAVIAQMIQMAQQRGQIPAEIHASKPTIDAIKETLPPVRDMRSPLQRMIHTAPTPTGQLRILQLPVVENSKVIDGVIALRMDVAMGDPNWLDETMNFQGGDVPWLERTESTQVESDDAAPTLSSLASSSGRASASDVLMKAFDGIDRTRDIIVIRMQEDGNIELSATVDRMAMMGALQIAMSYVMNQR